jgi:hypothetical protein
VTQDTRIFLQLVDGRNGKPLANHRLLVFAGESPEPLRLHQSQFEVFTDKNGVAALTGLARTAQWIQVWPDWMVLCQHVPNSSSFSVAEILSTGLNTPNTCGSAAPRPTPGRLVVFARPMHFWEKMGV